MSLPFPTWFAGLLALAWASSSVADAADVAYVTSEGSGELVVVDAGSLDVVRRIEIGGSPHNLAVLPDGRLVVATQSARSIAIVDPTRDPPTIGRIDTGVAPHDITVGADDRTISVISERGGLLVSLDPGSGRIVRRTHLDGRPHNAAASGATTWVTDTSARRLFAVNGETVRELPISIVGHDVAVRPGSAELWVTGWSSRRAVVFDLNAREQLAEIPVGQAASHKHIAFDEDGGRAWISEPGTGTIFVVDARSRQVVQAIDVGGHPHHVSFGEGRANVVAGPGALVAFDARTGAIVGRGMVGTAVHDVGLAP